tara:strand:+ start:603 stop:794 length:192 start_codon:yes stop_codon:yes gene_type:complete
MITANIRRQPMCSLNRKEEKTNTKMGDVNRPAPASAMGIIGITPKYSSMDVHMQTVRARTGFQ